MAEREVISTLNTLIETCRDGEEGFKAAAEHVRDSTVKALFNEAAQERARFAEELQQEVQQLGGRPEEGGSLAGAAHRGWISVRDAVTGRDDAAIIAEAERGEDAAVATYRNALEAALPENVQSVVHRQYDQVQRVHDQVRALEVTRKS